MKELVIISGKGGTGKTSVVGALASLAARPVLVDCDVDAANLHLITQPRNGESRSFIGGEKAWIDPEKCRGAGTCANVCRFDAIIASNGQDTSDRPTHSVDPYACEGCGVCFESCPEKAIRMQPAESGEWFTATTRFGPMVHGRLGIAESNSGKLVTLLRTQARELAMTRGLELVLIDGPPGIGCPAIASLTGASFALVVTEPTLAAFHDLRRAIDLAGRLKVPTGICINKFDINQDVTTEIETWAESHGIDVLGRLPYDSCVTSAQVAGKTLTEIGLNPLTQPLAMLWEVVNKRLVDGKLSDLNSRDCLENQNRPT